MTIEELEYEAREFLQDKYEVKLDIPIKINNRLKTTLGYFEHIEDKALCIGMSGKLIKFAHRDIILDTLYHECIHYALWKKGIPFEDGTHEFESELKKYNVGSTGVEILFGECAIYTCKKCFREFITDSKDVISNPKRYQSPCCYTEILIEKEFILDGTEKSLNQVAS